MGSLRGSGEKRRKFAQGTYLTIVPPWNVYVGGATLCPDGRVRKLTRVGKVADTWFSVPAAVNAHGKTVAGYVTLNEVDPFNGPHEQVLEFSPYRFRKNWDVFAGCYPNKDTAKTELFPDYGVVLDIGGFFQDRGHRYFVWNFHGGQRLVMEQLLGQRVRIAPPVGVWIPNIKKYMLLDPEYVAEAENQAGEDYWKNFDHEDEVKWDQDAFVAGGPGEQWDKLELNKRFEELQSRGLMKGTCKYI